MSKEYGIKCSDHEVDTFGKRYGDKLMAQIIQVAPQAKKVLSTIEDSGLNVLGWMEDGMGPSLNEFLIEHGDCHLIGVDEYGRQQGQEGYL